MISIRAQLLWTLLPTFIGISVAAGFGIYYSTQAELEARLDARLAGVAVDLRFLTPGADRGAVRGKTQQKNREYLRNRQNQIRTGGNIAQLQDTMFTNLSENVYCEIWLGNRELHLKTDNLEDAEITRPSEFDDDPVFYNALLMDGHPLRAWAARLPMMRDREKQSPKVILAIDRTEVDETLVRVARNLIGGAIACCLILSLLLIIALRISLRPLKHLGEKAAAMDAESLHERFAERSFPSDIRPIVERLNSLMSKLEESFARERRFSGDLAHELRTPLAAIRTTSEVALKWPEQASAEDFDEIHRISSGLQQTLDSLLLLARMESSAARKSTERINPAKLADECIALHRAKAEERSVKINAELDRTAEIETDPALMQIIMTNLIGNAVEYAPEGSEITVKVGEDGMVFQCLNEAPDLSNEDVDHLFERMWRKDSARTESGHAGLGLSIAKASADALNLELSAKLDSSGQLSVSVHS